MAIAYFLAIFITFFHVSTAVDYVEPDLDPVPYPVSNFRPGICPQPNPQYIVYPQFNPTSGSMFANEPSVVIFTNTFIQAVYNSELLRDAFDFSQTTVQQYIDFAYKYNYDQLSYYGFENAASLAEFGVRAIAPNFDVITMPYMIRFKANLAANFLYVEGILSVANAESLALTYAEIVKNYAQVGLSADPTSKFFVLTDSFIDFVSSVDPNAIKKLPFIVWLYGNEWFVGAINYKWFNQY